MQELINKLKQLKYSEINEQAWDAYDSVMDIAKELLEKEKETMCEFADQFAIECINFHHEKTMSQEQFFNLTFNTKEK